MPTLDQIRANLKSGTPRVVTSVATPSGPKSESYVAPSSGSKSDPLAAIRNKVKGSKSSSTTTPAAPTSNNLLPTESNTGTRLARLEKVVNAIAATLPASQLTTLKADVAAITAKTTTAAQ